MYIAIVTNDYDNIASNNYTEYDHITLSYCTNSENIIAIIIPLFTIIPCGLSLLCL